MMMILSSRELQGGIALVVWYWSGCCVTCRGKRGKGKLLYVMDMRGVVFVCVKGESRSRTIRFRLLGTILLITIF
ncbi:hypothetical protein F5X96DRAFT_642922 [Biscogniauxia mediterranea]|nr:hypothetical protein F5X96DRAFT_642922 [Biscogniauxia mediterranea]